MRIIRITTVPISMNILLKDQLRFINQFYEVTGVTGYDEKHFNEVKEREGIKMEVVEMERAISPLKDLRALWKIYRLLKKEKPAIVHTHTPKAGLLGMLAARFAGVPVRLHTVAGLPLLETSGAKRRLLIFTEELTYKCAHRIYPNSHGLLKIIRENNFCPENKLKVIGNGSSNGINTEYFAPHVFEQGPEVIKKLRETYGIGEDDFIYCFVGRLAREKGIKELVDAFESIVKNNLSHKRIKLLLVGPIEKHYGALDEATLERIIQNQDILGVGRHDDIRPFLFISDIFVFPSYREGFPGVVLQAGAMGLGSIVTNINGCNEIIRENENGLIVGPKSTKELKAAMERVLIDDELRAGFALNARNMVERQFKRELIWEGLLKEYNFLAEEIK